MRSLLFSVCVVGLLTACGSSESPPSSSTSSSSSSGSSSSGNSGSSSGGSSGGSSSGTVGAAEPFTPKAPAKRGALNVYLRSPAGSQKLSIAGTFLDYSTSNGFAPDGFSRGSSKATDCTKRTIGACELAKCKLTPDPSFAFAPPKLVSAGDITFTRSSDSVDVKVSPDNGMTYQRDADSPGVLAANETVKIAATGADVPAFTETVAFLPAVGRTVEQVFATNGDVEITWTNGAGPGKLQVSGESGSEDTGFVAMLTCTFDIAASKGSIPIAVLEDVRGNTFGMSMRPQWTTKTIGGFEVDLNVVASGSDPESGFSLVVAQ